MQHPILWIHGEALGPANPALGAYPGRPAVFVFDAELLAGRSPTTGDPASPHPQPVSLKRIGFLYECLLELPVSLRHGDVAAEVLAFARAHGADGIVTSAGTDPRVAAIGNVLAQELPVQVLEPEPFVQLEEGVDLGRFSRYWRRAERAVWARWSPAEA
ncbi:MAG: hypothetical protein ACO3EF_09880 [Vulcanococcus sp.]